MGKFMNWALCLLVFYLGCVQAADKTVTDLEEAVKKSTLKCYICNSAMENCDPATGANIKYNCGKSHISRIYGISSLSNKNLSLKEWPPSLSELANEGSLNGTWNEIGYGPKNFPGSHEEGKRLIDVSNGTVFSSLYNAWMEGGKDLNVDSGLSSCQVIKIIVEPQNNGGREQALKENNPRIIRSCSFVDWDKKKSDSSFKNGCKKINHKAGIVEVCYCNDKDFCNSSDKFKASLGILLASFLLFFM